MTQIYPNIPLPQSIFHNYCFFYLSVMLLLPVHVSVWAGPWELTQQHCFAGEKGNQCMHMELDREGWGQVEFCLGRDTVFFAQIGEHWISGRLIVFCSIFAAILVAFVCVNVNVMQRCTIFLFSFFILYIFLIYEKGAL